MLYKPFKVLSRENLTEDVYELTLEKSDSFLPGQMVGIKAEKREAERLYSISSGSSEQSLRFLFDLQPEGLLTPRLALWPEGTPLLVSPPRGEFLYSGEPAVWVATGTGIAPFLSMMRSGLAEDVLCIHGARKAEGFYRQKEWTAALGERYIRCLSRGESPGCYTGRLTAFLRDWKDLPLDVPWYLCGSTAMVVQVRDLLLSRGVPFTGIRTEIYF